MDDCTKAGDGVVAHKRRRVDGTRRYRWIGRRAVLIGAVVLATLALLGAASATPRGEWVHTQAVVEPDPDDQTYFGASLAIADGMALIGAPTDSWGDSTGAVHVYTVAGGRLTPHLVLEAWDGAPADGFGAGVALSEDLAVVSAPHAEAVYVYNRTGSRLDPAVKLTPPPEDALGWGGTVGIAERRVVVGSSTATHVFHEVDGTWRTEARLLGGRVSADRDRVAIRAADGLHVFARERVTWQHEAHLDVPADGVRSHALHGRVVAVGEPDTEGVGGNQGSATMFRQTLDGWQADDVLTVPAGTPRDDYSWFGFAVAIDDTTAVVTRVTNYGDIGIAHVYEQRRNRWIEVAQLVSDLTYEGWFGSDVAIDDDTILVNETGTGGGYLSTVHVYHFRD